MCVRNKDGLRGSRGRYVEALSSQLHSQASGHNVSALLKQTGINAQTFTHTHSCAHGYLQFLYEHFFWLQCVSRERGEETARFRSTDRFDPSLRTGSFFFASLCATSHPLCHSTFHSRLFSSNSLPDRGRGAALLLRAEHRGQCRAGYTQKGMVRQGGDCWFRSVCSPNLGQLGAMSRRVL